MPQHKVSNTALRELRILFNRKTNNDASKYLSTSQCFQAVMDTPECKAVQMGLNSRQEGVHELLLKLLEHFHEESRVTAHTSNLFFILKIHLLSTTTCQQCPRSTNIKEYFWLLTLPFPVGSNEDAPAAISTAL